GLREKEEERQEAQQPKSDRQGPKRLRPKMHASGPVHRQCLPPNHNVNARTQATVCSRGDKQTVCMRQIISTKFIHFRWPICSRLSLILLIKVMKMAGK